MIIIFAGHINFYYALLSIFCRYSINNLYSTHLKLEKFFFNQIAVAEFYVNVKNVNKKCFKCKKSSFKRTVHKTKDCLDAVVIFLMLPMVRALII